MLQQRLLASGEQPEFERCSPPPDPKFFLDADCRAGTLGLKRVSFRALSPEWPGAIEAFGVGVLRPEQPAWNSVCGPGRPAGESSENNAGADPESLLANPTGRLRASSPPLDA